MGLTPEYDGSVRIKDLNSVQQVRDDLQLASDLAGGNTEKISVGQLLSDVTLTGEASGAIASFSDALDASMKSCTVSIEPVQDLHGYDHPWAGGAGKNLLPMTVDGIKAANSRSTWSGNSTTISNVTFTIQTDSDGNVTGISVSGTSNGVINFILATNQTLKSGTYTLSHGGVANASGIYNAYLYVRDVGESITLIDDSLNGITSKTAELSSDIANVMYYFNINSNITMSGTILPQLESGNQPTTFAPYSNVCPITGHDEVTVDVVGKNLFDYDNYDIIDVAGNGAYRNGHIFKAGTYTVINDSSSSLFYKTVKEDLSSYGGSSQIFNGIPINVTVQSGYLLYVYSDVTPTSICVAVGENQTFAPYNPNSATYTIDLGTTVYGGTLDLVSGVLTVDMAMVDLGTLNFSKFAAQNGNAFTALVSDAKFWNNVSDTHILCSEFPEDKSQTNAYFIANNTCKMGGSYFGGKNFTVVTTMYDSKAAFESAMSGVQLVYELANPYTVQLDPVQVRSLLGTNNVWSDSGEMASVVYVRDINTVIGDILTRLETLEPSRSAKSVEAPAEEEEKPEEEALAEDPAEK